MQVIYQNSIEQIPPSAVTVGFFDGVHAGHRFLLNELRVLAANNGLKSLVVTFASHPRKALDTSYKPDVLTSLTEKLILLEQVGIDFCLVLSFTEQMSLLSASDFMHQYLVKVCNARLLLIGHDHRFGHNRSDGFNEYTQYGLALGMQVFQAKQFFTQSEKHISSSQIRNAIRNGQPELARSMLGYGYIVRGKVIDGFKVGRKIGFPTANLQPDDPDKLLPALGVYAVQLSFSGNIYTGMMNIGTRPTLSKEQRVSIEVHIFDFNQDIYNQHLEVRLYYRIREELKFCSVEQLIEQLKRDKEKAIHLLKNIM